MRIDLLIAALQAEQARRGLVDVTVWQYGGGRDDLCSVAPVYDEQLDVVVLETTLHESGTHR